MKTLSQHWTLFSIIVLIAGAAWIWSSAAPPGSTTGGHIPAPRAGFLAPDFTLQTLEGETLHLADLSGQAVLINLWASWCTPCRAEMPAIQRVYDEYQAQGFTVLAINATNQDSERSARDFAKSHGLTFPILLDPAGEASSAYELRALPTSFFVDREGIIREVVVGGPMSEALLRIRVQQILEGSD